VLQRDEVAALVERHKATQARISSRTAAQLVRIWDGLDGYDEADVATFLRLAGPHTFAAKRTAITVAVGFYAAILQLRPPAIPIGSIDVEYNARSPFTAVWHALSEGRSYDEAVTAGRSITEAQTDRFVASAARRTGDHVTTATRTRVAWERVPRAAACGFCRDAAGQRYKTSETADFGHDRCGCTAVPVAL